MLSQNKLNFMNKCASTFLCVQITCIWQVMLLHLLTSTVQVIFLYCHNRVHQKHILFNCSFDINFHESFFYATLKKCNSSMTIRIKYKMLENQPLNVRRPITASFQFFMITSNARTAIIKWRFIQQAPICLSTSNSLLCSTSIWNV